MIHLNCRLKWVAVLSLLSILVWACTQEEETATQQPNTQEPPATVEKSRSDTTASEEKNTTDQGTAQQNTETGTQQVAMQQADMETGKKVYEQSCASCHDQGIAGSPKLTDTAYWEERLELGMETLNDHAINGFQGERGMMPAKGGNSSLSDAEVEAAVAYMIAEATE